MTKKERRELDRKHAITARLWAGKSERCRKFREKRTAEIHEFVRKYKNDPTLSFIVREREEREKAGIVSARSIIARHGGWSSSMILSRNSGFRIVRASNEQPAVNPRSCPTRSPQPERRLP